MSDSNVWEVSSNWRTRSSNDAPAPTSARSSGWRNDNGEGRSAQRQPIKHLAERPRSDDVNVHRPERQRDDPEAEQTIAEGRRIYVGNLLYQATPKDIEELLATNGLDPCEKIHMSIDSFNSRNPGYCFVEFGDRETAENAIATLDSKLLFERPVKSRPCQPKSDRRRDVRESGDYYANRWGDWGNKGERRDQYKSTQYQDRVTREGRQLYVGGLPRMLDQALNDEEMRDIFKDFKVEDVSKRVSPGAQTHGLPGRHNFCFVNFSDPQQAKLALEQVDGTEYRGGQLKVSYAKSRSQAREQQKY